MRPSYARLGLWHLIPFDHSYQVEIHCYVTVVNTSLKFCLTIILLLTLWDTQAYMYCIGELKYLMKPQIVAASVIIVDNNQYFLRHMLKQISRRYCSTGTNKQYRTDSIFLNATATSIHRKHNIYICYELKDGVIKGTFLKRSEYTICILQLRLSDTERL